jgi:hypothetical protein
MYFNDLLQNRVQLATTLFAGENIQHAYANSYLAQSPINEARVNAIVKDIVKSGQLWQAITVASVTGLGEFVASGRHRFAAAVIICRDYVVLANGKIVARAGIAEGVVAEDIELAMECLMVELASAADLVEYLQAANGSRSMTRAEILEGQVFGGTIKSFESVKLQAAKALVGRFDELDCGYMPTLQTCLKVVGKIASSIGKKAKFMTLGDFATCFTQLLDGATYETFEGNFSLNGYSELVEIRIACAESPEEMFDDKGVTVPDTTWAMWFADALEAPAKAKKASKTAELQATIAQLQAQLAQRGVAS